jgi:hypothetical protein
MPDLQTEMQKILQDWETPETTQPTEEPMFTTTTNTSRASFEIVRDDPGLPKAQYIRKLEALGHKKSSTSSLLSQMVRQGHLWVDSSGCLRPNQQEYKALKAATTLRNQTKKAKPVKTSKVITSTPKTNGIDALVAEHTEVVRQLSLRSKVDTILDEISLSDAHALYRHLHQYFGNFSK